MAAKPKFRWVIKAGSNIVCNGGPLLIRAWMQQVALLRRDFGIEVIWVTSGAIASAVERTHFVAKMKNTRNEKKLSEKQALSAIGQPLVMDLYNIALQATGLLGAQILLTYSDLADDVRKENFRNTLEELLAWGVVPVLNENDAVATEEIRFGDNDSLSAKVALVSGADRLLILTDVDGLYDADPARHPRAKLIPKIEGVSAKLLKTLKKGTERSRPANKPSRGTGGMYSKIRAADEASRGGTETWLVRGDIPSVLLRAARQEVIGTIVEVPSC